MDYNEQSEKIITKSLELLENGKSESEILNLFPKYKKELEELFQTLTTVQATKQTIHPPKELLYKIFSQIPSEQPERQQNHTTSLGFATWLKFAVPIAIMTMLMVVFRPSNIDTLIDETIALTDNRQFAPNEDVDAVFINADDQVLDDFDQFYNEEEL